MKWNYKKLKTCFIKTFLFNCEKFSLNQFVFTLENVS